METGRVNGVFPGMKFNPLTLNFPGKLESEFREDYFRNSINQLRISFVLGLIYYGSFAILDHMVIPGAQDYLFNIRFFIVCPVILIVFLLSFTRSFRRWWQTAAGIAIVVSGLGIVAMTLLVPEVGRSGYYVGIILVLIYCYMLIRLRFIGAAIAGSITSAAYIASLVFFNPLKSGSATANAFFLISANLMGMFGSYLLEFFTRKEFHWRKLLYSERMKVEEANIILEEEVAEKTAELFQAQKMEAVGRLAGGVAHDYNNMLSVILGYSELAMENSDKNRDPGEFIIEIKAAAERSRAITDQLLTFARKQNTIPQNIELNQSINDMIKLLKILTGENIELVWTPCQEELPAKLDPAQLNQMLANLCVNSRDAIKHHGRIIISTEKRTLLKEQCEQWENTNPGDYAVIVVADNGHGIEKEVLRQIFEPFFTTKERGKGTGLGLSTVYGIAMHNGGSIKVESVPGKGTEFAIILPLAETAHEPHEQDSSPALPLSKGETILVVEDEPQILKMTVSILRELKYEALESLRAENALDLLKDEGNHVDLLLTDVVMPGMNGKQLAEKARNIRPELKVIFMSGYTADIVVETGLRGDDNNLLRKPFTMDQLAVRMRQALDS